MKEKESLLFKLVEFIDGSGQGFVFDIDSEFFFIDGKYIEECRCVVKMNDGRVIETLCENLMQVGGSVSKYVCGQTVRILSDKFTDLPDKIAEVIGIAYDNKDKKWYYTVLLSGEATIFLESELTSDV